MKHLPKHLRPRWRYLAVGIETWPDAEIDRSDFQRALWYEAQNLVGDTGSAALDLSVQRFEHSEGDGEAVVRTRSGEVDRARAVLASVAAVDGEPVGLRVRGVSGTLRGCEEKYMGRAPIATEQRHVAFAGAERAAHQRAERIDVRTDDAYLGATTLDID